MNVALTHPHRLCLSAIVAFVLATAPDRAFAAYDVSAAWQAYAQGHVAVAPCTTGENCNFLTRRAAIAKAIVKVHCGKSCDLLPSPDEVSTDGVARCADIDRANGRAPNSMRCDVARWLLAVASNVDPSTLAPSKTWVTQSFRDFTARVVSAAKASGAPGVHGGAAQ